MAFLKTTLASGFTITQNNGTVTYTPTSPADVMNTYIPVTYSTSSTIPATAGTTSFRPASHIRHPGVFIQGTAPEGTISNPTNDSNS